MCKQSGREEDFGHPLIMHKCAGLGYLLSFLSLSFVFVPVNSFSSELSFMFIDIVFSKGKLAFSPACYFWITSLFSKHSRRKRRTKMVPKTVWIVPGLQSVARLCLKMFPVTKSSTAQKWVGAFRQV